MLNPKGQVCMCYMTVVDWSQKGYSCAYGKTQTKCLKHQKAKIIKRKGISINCKEAIYITKSLANISCQY